MSVTIVGSDDALAERLGKLFYALEKLNAARDPETAGSWAEAVDDIFANFEGAAPDLLALIAPLTAARTSGARGNDVVAKAIRTAAENLLIYVLDTDDPLPTPTLAEALARYLSLLKGGTHSIEANTLGATPTLTGLNGTGIIVVSTLDGEGRPLENLRAETLRVRVASVGTSNEQLTVLGEPAQTDGLAYDWPGGSGSLGRYTSIAAGSDGKLGTDGTFETFTVAHTPDGWTLGPGVAGTDFFQEGTEVYEGDSSLGIAFDGSTLPMFKKQITGLAAKTPYAFVIAIKMDAAPATGVLTIDLHDGTSVIADEAGNNNTTTVDLVTHGTAWKLIPFVARLPDPVPAAIWLRYHMTTAGENGKTLYADSLRFLTLAQPRANLPGGVPFLGFARGDVGWALEDGAPDGVSVFQIATTNNRASKQATYHDRVFDLAGKGLRIPTSGSPTIADSLIA